MFFSEKRSNNAVRRIGVATCPVRSLSREKGDVLQALLCGGGFLFYRIKGEVVIKQACEWEVLLGAFTTICHLNSIKACKELP